MDETLAEIVRAAVAPEVQAQHPGGSSQERAVLDDIGCDRTRVAVKQHDRLVRVRPPTGAVRATAVRLMSSR